MLKRVLITDKVHDLLPVGLKELGFSVDYDTSVDNAKLDKIIHEYDGIIINSKIILDQARIDKGTNLLFIGRLGSGLEIIDVKYAKNKGIAVYNSPEGNRNAVAEHEFAMILGLLNNLVRSDSEVRNFQWNREKNRGVELSGKTIGIIGMGHTGISFAEKLSPWRLNVISYDKYRERYPASLRFVKKVDIETVIRESDIISIHLPLTEETKYLVNQDFLSRCKDGVIISNTSRGQQVDTMALIGALVSKKVGGACLDVFENEKPETYSEEEKGMYQQLYSFENVILSPHIAGWTDESLVLIASILLNKIKAGKHC
ncbi:MAG TPA: NAD(P)-dependent oxidoreductase [Saprospiraceae bacterium]|nr:NAD(P)-dependent oxidoreductase [Saprospiraceae bacterium]